MINKEEIFTYDSDLIQLSSKIEDDIVLYTLKYKDKTVTDGIIEYAIESMKYKIKDKDVRDELLEMYTKVIKPRKYVYISKSHCIFPRYYRGTEMYDTAEEIIEGEGHLQYYVTEAPFIEEDIEIEANTREEVLGKVIDYAEQK